MRDFPSVEASLRRLMTAAAIPGVALAVVDKGKVKVMTMGVAELKVQRPVVESTVFDVASLSKPVAAYIALQLVDSVALDLNAPLSSIVQLSMAREFQRRRCHAAPG